MAFRTVAHFDGSPDRMNPSQETVATSIRFAALVCMYSLMRGTVPVDIAFLFMMAVLLSAMKKARYWVLIIPILLCSIFIWLSSASDLTTREIPTRHLIFWIGGLGCLFVSLVLLSLRLQCLLSATKRVEPSGVVGSPDH